MDMWICRACWNRNKASADRCAICKTSRYAEDRDVERQRQVLQEAQENVVEVVPDEIVAVPVMAFLIMVWVQKVSAIFIVLFSLLVAPFAPLYLPFGGLDVPHPLCSRAPRQRDQELALGGTDLHGCRELAIGLPSAVVDDRPQREEARHQPADRLRCTRGGAGQAVEDAHHIDRTPRATSRITAAARR